MPNTSHKGTLSLGCVWIMMVLVGMASLAVADTGLSHETVAQPTARPVADPGYPIRVGSLVYAGGKTALCFSSGFLATVDRQTRTQVSRRLERVGLGDEAIFSYPLLVMAGQGGFALSASETANLRAYLDRGGLLIASAGCSDPEWAQAFRRVAQQLYPESAMERLTLDHPVFHTLYDIDRLPTRKASAQEALLGLRVGDRLAVVFSPLGLNDTDRAGPGCRCCCGNELRNARLINANILVYALTH